MKIKERKSKLWYLFKLLFPRAELKHVFIAFGDTVWIAKGDTIGKDFIIHEKTHLLQQEFCMRGALRWWGKYTFSKKFRYRQELEAYSDQLVYLHGKLQKRRFYRYLNAIARIMAHPMYGNMCTYEQARGDLIEILNV